MLRSPMLMILVLVLAGTFTGKPTQAQMIEISSGDIQMDPGLRPTLEPEGRIFEGTSEREAVRIARRQGLRELDRVQPNAQGGWTVTGFRRDGREMRVVISHFGEVLRAR